MILGLVQVKMAEQVLSDVSSPKTVQVRTATGQEVALKAFETLTIQDPSISEETRDGMLRTEKKAEELLHSTTPVHGDILRPEEVGENLQICAADIDEVLKMHSDTFGKLTTRKEWLKILKRFLTDYMGSVPAVQGNESTDQKAATGTGVTQRKLTVSIILCYGIIRQKARDMVAGVVGETYADVIVLIVEALIPYILAFLFHHVNTIAEWISSNWPIGLTIICTIGLAVGLYGLEKSK